MVKGEIIIPGYRIKLLNIVVREENELVNIPSHNKVDASGKSTKTPCSIRKGHVRLEGGYPLKRAKVRCGFTNEPNPICWKAWR